LKELNELVGDLQELFYPLSVKDEKDGYTIVTVIDDKTVGVTLAHNIGRALLRYSTKDRNSVVNNIKKNISYSIKRKVLYDFLNSSKEDNGEQYIVEMACPEDKNIIVMHPKNYAEYLREKN